MQRHFSRVTTCIRSIGPFLRVSSHLHTSARHSQEQQEDMDELVKNPYYAKYADKLKKVQESKPEEFQSKLDVLEQEKKQLEEERKETIENEKKRLMEKASQVKAGPKSGCSSVRGDGGGRGCDLAASISTIPEHKTLKTAGTQRVKNLEAIMKTELLQDKTIEEITEIWTKYHQEKPCIFAVIPTAEYEQLMERSQAFKMFIYPIPRGTGYEFFIQQFDGHMITFTPVIQYQALWENAPVALRVTHYMDFKDKGIVLMRGDPDTNILSVSESQLLALQVKMYYGTNAGLKYNLVRMFNTAPDQFKHMDLVKEFENYKKDIQVAKDGTF